MYSTVVIGASAGGVQALLEIIPRLPRSYAGAVIIVHHIKRGGGELAGLLNAASILPVKEAEDKETIEDGRVYIAPSDYHLLIEDDKTFALNCDPCVNYARPSINVLFESAARVYSAALVGVILSGANEDGANGLRAIKEAGGVAVVQNPDTAEISTMPRAAIAATTVDHILSLPEIASFLSGLNHQTRATAH